MVFQRCLLPVFGLAMLALFAAPASASLVLYTTSNTALVQLSLTDGSSIATETYTDLLAPGSLTDVKGLAYNPNNTTLYGIFDLNISGVNTPELVTIDPNTGNYSVVTSIDITTIGTDSGNLTSAPAFDSAGVFYMLIGGGSAGPGSLETLNLSNGSFTNIGTLTFQPNGPRFAWDAANSRLVATTLISSPPNSSSLLSVNTSTGALSSFGTASGAQLFSNALAVNPSNGYLLGIDLFNVNALEYINLSTGAVAGTLTNYNNAGNSRSLVFINSVASATPEPASAALLLAGGAALWFLRKRFV